MIDATLSVGEQLLQLCVDKVDIPGIGARTAREMAPDRGNRVELRIRHVGNLELAVLGREVQIGLAGMTNALALIAPSAILKSPLYSSLSLISPFCQVHSIVSRLLAS